MEIDKSSTKKAVSPKVILSEKSTRLHYLDWLQVLAVLGDFIFQNALLFAPDGKKMKSLSLPPIAFAGKCDMIDMDREHFYFPH